MLKICLCLTILPRNIMQYNTAYTLTHARAYTQTNVFQCYFIILIIIIIFFFFYILCFPLQLIFFVSCNLQKVMFILSLCFTFCSFNTKTNLISLLKVLYGNNKTKVKINGDESKESQMRGCLLYPQLFNTYAEYMNDETCNG